MGVAVMVTGLVFDRLYERNYLRKRAGLASNKTLETIIRPSELLEKCP